MKHFKRSEFRCPCCGIEHMVDSFLERLDNARDIAQVAFKINSGYRCPIHNQKVGGSATSSHLMGIASDIAATSSAPRFKIVKALIASGISRIGIAKTFIHADDDASKDQGVIWLY